MVIPSPNSFPTPLLLPTIKHHLHSSLFLSHKATHPSIALQNGTPARRSRDSCKLPTEFVLMTQERHPQQHWKHTSVQRRASNKISCTQQTQYLPQRWQVNPLNSDIKTQWAECQSQQHSVHISGEHRDICDSEGLIYSWESEWKVLM